jgi:hypothetical protein
MKDIQKGIVYTWIAGAGEVDRGTVYQKVQAKRKLRYMYHSLCR